MQVVIAIIKPFKLEDVREALEINGVNGVTAIEVKGFGRQRGHKEIYRGAEYVVDWVVKTAVISLVPDDRVEQIKRDIRLVANTGKIGDGIVFSLPVEEYMRIRTGEQVTDEEY